MACAIALAGSAHAQRPTQGEDETAALVEEARSALRSGALDHAAKALDQAIALNPRRVEAYVLRSAVYAARKQYRQGVALMRRAEQLAPADDDVLTALGSQLVLAGDAPTGVPILASVTRRDPARYDAQLLLGRQWYGDGNWPEAIGALEAYFAHRPAALANDDAARRTDLADAYLRDHQPAKALAMFRTVPGDVRARLGAAWATAALDCRKARPLLHELEPIAQQHPEIWLVDGRCALALGDPAAALERGHRYLERAAAATSPPATAAGGHALVAEAELVRGDIIDARHELELARQLDPDRRRWTVRLAFARRRAGDPSAGLDALDKLGPPSEPARDPDWWIEAGECLLAHGDAQAAIARVSPIVAGLPNDAEIRVVLGAAQLAAGQTEVAATTLGEAEAIHSAPRSRRLLVEALTSLAVAKLAASDAAGAEPLLVRADQIEGTPAVWRDLGIVRLTLGRYSDAAAVLDRAAKQDASAATQMLDARAHAMAGDVAGARPIYDRTLAADKANVELAIDWAASELAGGDPSIAVAALERTAAVAKPSPLAARHRAALAQARHAAGLAALRAGNAARAVELLRASAAAEPELATRCDLALAAAVADEPNAALGALRAVVGQRCPFPAPADTQAAPILIAFIEGRSAASKALDKLTALTGRSTGPARALLDTALRVVALEAAQDAYRSGRLAQARGYLQAARAANARIGSDELAHDLAVLDLADGKLDPAIAELERLSAKLPEALVNLGLAYERKGDQPRALDAWRRARKAGVRFPALGDWIDAKQRIYGDAP